MHGWETVAECRRKGGRWFLRLVSVSLFCSHPAVTVSWPGPGQSCREFRFDYQGLSLFVSHVPMHRHAGIPTPTPRSQHHWRLQPAPSALSQGSSKPATRPGHGHGAVGQFWEPQQHGRRQYYAGKVRGSAYAPVCMCQDSSRALRPGKRLSSQALPGAYACACVIVRSCLVEG